MKRPVVYVCLSTILGILIAGYINWVISLLLLLLSVVFFCMRRTEQHWKLIIILLIFCVFGYVNTARIDWNVDRIVRFMNFEETIEAVGTIQTIKYENDRYVLTCLIQEISQNHHKIKGSVKAIVYVKSNEVLKIDDTLTLTGKLQGLKKPTNPGGFDTYRYHYSKKVYFNLYAERIHILKSNYGVRRFFGNIRAHLMHGTNKIFPSTEAGIMNTLLLGSKEDLDTSIKKLYQVSGISHLLAISGLHVSVIGMGIFQLLKKLIKKDRVCATIACFVLWMYCFLSGVSTSVLRSTIMLTLMLLTYFFGEKYDIFSSLFLSGLIILCLNPYQLLDVGFLLSFSAVGGIITITPALEARYNQNKNGLLSLLFVTIGASLFTYPILANFFYQISAYAIIINLIVVPSAAVLIGFGILALLISLISTFMGNIFAGIVYFVLNYIEMICSFTMWLPLHTIAIRKPILLAILIYYLALVLWVNIKKVRYARLLLHLIIVIFFIGVCSSQIIHHDELRITFLDVGQGDSSVIEYRNKVYLIDGGGDMKSTSEFNKGHYVVIPYLSSRGINHIDGIFISHSDFDHIYGIIEVIREMPIDFIVLPEPYVKEQDELIQELLSLANEKEIKVHYFNTGYRFDNQELSLFCVYPGAEKLYYPNNNAKSMVLKLTYKKFSALFTGDIEEQQEQEIIHLSNLRSDVIKVPHHGSGSSSSVGFIETVEPQLAVFSYGLYNSFGHPSQSVVERYMEQNTESFHIAMEGAVIITTKGHTFKAEGFYSNRKETYLCNN